MGEVIQNHHNLPAIAHLHCNQLNIMAIIQNWMPPSKENYELIVFLFQFFPLVTIFQWVQPWYGAGKTSTNSRFNIPGKIAWITMETPGLLTLFFRAIEFGCAAVIIGIFSYYLATLTDH